jgi:aryl-alcohol dehydrogenase-like predicted oxidoreductase
VTYSLMDRKMEEDLIPAARELGVVGFGVLLSGLIGGSNPQHKLDHIKHMRTPATLENFHQNLALSEALTALAAEKNASTQLAIAWVLAQGEDILALVGCRTPEQVQNAIQALAITLTEDDLARIEQILPREKARNNYMPAMNLAENGLFKW